MLRLFTRFPSGLCGARYLCTSRTLYGSVVPFKLADIGEGILQVEVLNVCVKPGDKVDELDRICEVQSDKATVEITSRFCGTVKAVHVTRGAITRVGSPLIDIEIDDAAAAPNGHHAEPTPPQFGGDAQQKSQNGAQPNGKANGVLATPATRRMAKEYGIDLSHVKATGRGGRVMKEDVLAFVESRNGTTLATAAPTTIVMSAKAPDALEAVDEEIIPISGIRRVMAAAMTEAHAIPSFTACDEINVAALLHVRNQLRDALARETKSAAAAAAHAQTKLTLMPFFLKAASLALRQFPLLNAHVPAGCEKIIVRRAHHIGVAMDTPGGLLVPVLRNVQQKTLMELAAELSELVALARANRITPSHLRDGTFTLSNIGPIGATYATPMLVPPQVGIGALGRMQTLPRFDEAGNVVKANIMYVSWTADHRVIDGATLVRFGNTFKQYLEAPATMIGDMR